MISDEYAAGYLDGEGSFAISHQSNGVVKRRVQVTSTHLPTLKLLQDAWGGQIYTKKLTAISRKPLYTWLIVRSSGAEAMLAAIIPHMVEKREAAELLLESMRGMRRQHVRAYRSRGGITRVS